MMKLEERRNSGGGSGEGSSAEDPASPPKCVLCLSPLSQALCKRYAPLCSSSQCRVWSLHPCNGRSLPRLSPDEAAGAGNAPSVDAGENLTGSFEQNLGSHTARASQVAGCFVGANPIFPNPHLESARESGMRQVDHWATELLRLDEQVSHLCQTSVRLFIMMNRQIRTRLDNISDQSKEKPFKARDEPRFLSRYLGEYHNSRPYVQVSTPTLPLAASKLLRRSVSSSVDGRNGST